MHDRENIGVYLKFKGNHRISSITTVILGTQSLIYYFL